MNLVKKFLSNIWAVFGSIFAILLLLLKIESDKRKDLKTKLDSIKTQLEHEKLESEKRVINSEINNLENDKNKVEIDLKSKKAEVEKIDQPSKIEDFWKKN